MRFEHVIAFKKLRSGNCGRVLKVKHLYIALVLLLSISISAQARNREEICVRVDTVGEAPGEWSGILAATQWLDATVIASSSKGHKVGGKIYFGLNVVKGDEFADRQTPRLNPEIIHAGAVLTLDTKASCRAEGYKGWIYNCVKRGCGQVTSNRGSQGHVDSPRPQ